MSKEREAASGAPEGARRATGGAPEERRDALWSGGGRSHEPRRFALHGTTLRRGACHVRMGDGAFQFLLSARNRRTTRASARTAGTKDGLERCCTAGKNPRSTDGLAVLWRGASQSVGVAALPGSAHVEGAGAAADARSAFARAVTHVSEGRESSYGHDHYGTA